MSQAFTVIVPARLASTRLPHKPLADIHGLPMVVRVAQRAALSNAAQVVVAADSIEIVQACQAHGVRAMLTQVDHPSGSDRLAEASALLGLSPNDVVVNVQGDEPLINPELINQVAELLVQRPTASMSTAAHEIHALAEFTNPNVVKVVIDQAQLALYFSRAPIPWWRDGFAGIIDDAAWRRFTQTGHYWFMFDADTVSIPRLGSAAVPPGEIPGVDLLLKIKVDGKTYYCENCKYIIR